MKTVRFEEHGPFVAVDLLRTAAEPPRGIRSRVMGFYGVGAVNAGQTPPPRAIVSGRPIPLTPLRDLCMRRARGRAGIVVDWDEHVNTFDVLWSAKFALCSSKAKVKGAPRARFAHMRGIEARKSI